MTAFPVFAVTLLLSLLAFAAFAQSPWPDAALGVIHEPGRCLMKHQCGPSSAPAGGLYDCLNNSMAEPIGNGDFYNAMQQTCPMLLLGQDNPTACCDANMLETLSSNLGTPYQLLSGCPSCLTNFLTLWCAITCGPNQSLYMAAVATQNITTIPDETTEITEVAYFLDSQFATTFYNSCMDVQFSETNSKVLTDLCGTSAADCNVNILLTFLGWIGNTQAPFQIDTYIDNIPTSNTFINPVYGFPFENQSNMNYPAYSCRNSTPYGGQPCSCQNCQLVCIAPPPTPAATHCKIGSLSCGVFFALIFYVVFAVALLVFLRFSRSLVAASDVSEREKLINIDHEAEEVFGERRDYEGALRVGALEAVLRGMFSRWGRICATYPFTVIAVSLLISGGLCVGIMKFNVTTDPVQLWSAPTSLSRLQKDQYDAAFGPFYRTTQVIVTAPNVPGESYLAFDNLGNTLEVHFTGVFSLYVLTELLQMQSEIMALTAIYEGETYGLGDICLRPLCNDTATERDKTCTVHNCTIFSPLNWFQNSKANLLKQECNLTCGADLPFVYSTKDPMHLGTVEPILGSICGMPNNSVCDCGCGPCEISNVTYCCTCPTKDSFDGQNKPSYDYHDHILLCTSDDEAISDVRGMDGVNLGSCLGEYGGPIFPNVALGGYDCVGEGSSAVCNYGNATALILTIPIDNHVNETLNGPAEAWETVFLNYMAAYSSNILTVAYSAERSTSDELAKSSSASEVTVAVSYLLMFLYVSVTLGSFPTRSERASGSCLKHAFVRSRLLLGLSGVIIVLISVAASLGFWSALGFSATLIVVEVVPFLTLAVGVDNIFILVHSFEETYHSNLDVKARLSMVMGEVGPSILLCSLSESVAFAIGAMSSMPAVKTFALFACGAVFFDFLLQITVFASLLALDAKRSESSRCDCFPCVQFEISEQPHSPSMISSVTKKLADVIIRPRASVACLILSVTIFAAAIVGMANVPIGLNQQLAFPTNSYINNYFDAINSYLDVGAPVYFVVSGTNYTTIESQNLVCGNQPGCNPSSIVQAVGQASGNPNYTRIALPVSSWIDDFIGWMQPSGKYQCCQVFTVEYNDTANNHTYYPNDFCGSFLGDDVRSNNCGPCNVTLDQSRPVEINFTDYLSFFLQDIPGVRCAQAGHAAYGTALELDGDVGIPIIHPVEVESSYFMTYHTKCVTSDDFTEALKQARALSDRVASDTGLQVFPYSVFYVYYEQYLTIVTDSIVGISVSVSAILVITSVLLGSLWAGIIITVTIIMIIVDVIGCMYLWGIDLNAISLVNLIMAVGIAVEFVAHITRSFCIGEGSRRQRAHHALAKMGSNVVSGIMCTKFAGIIVLAFSVSQIFEVFYFRMYLLIVIFGAFHGLIFLPVFLALAGPPERTPRAVDPSNLHSRSSVNSMSPHDYNGALPRKVRPPKPVDNYGSISD